MMRCSLEVQAVVIPRLEADAMASDTGFDYAATITRVEAFIGDGQQLRWRLAAIVHGDDTVEAGDREQIHAWQAMAGNSSEVPACWQGRDRALPLSRESDTLVDASSLDSWLRS